MSKNGKAQSAKKIHITHKINKVSVSKIYNNPLQIKEKHEEKWVRDLKGIYKRVYPNGP